VEAAKLLGEIERRGRRYPLREGCSTPLIERTREALRHFDDLRAQRYSEALRNLRAAVVTAADTIERDLLVGLPAPPAYPDPEPGLRVVPRSTTIGSPFG
jgi:hypothetical protein